MPDDPKNDTCKHCGRRRAFHGKPSQPRDSIVWTVNFGAKNEKKVKYLFSLKKCPGFAKKD